MHIPVHQLISFLLENETIPLLNPRICDSYVLNGHTAFSSKNAPLSADDRYSMYYYL